MFVSSQRLITATTLMNIFHIFCERICTLNSPLILATVSLKSLNGLMELLAGITATLELPSILGRGSNIPHAPVLAVYTGFDR